MFYTADPARDALEYEDAQEEAQERDEAARTRLSNDFVSAAEWGADEPIEGITVAEALYELQQSHADGCSLVEAFFYRAATQTKDPVLRDMVREVGDAWADIKQQEKTK